MTKRDRVCVNFTEEERKKWEETEEQELKETEKLINMIDNEIFRED